MEANEGGGGLAEGEDHAQANGGGGALANGGGHGLANGGGGAPANGGGHALANGANLQWIGPDNDAAANASMGNPALYLAILRLPAQEVARCRTLCTLWRNITGTAAFRRHYSNHRYRTPMPLVDFQDPDPLRVDLRAVDIRDRVTRPVLRFARPLNHEVFRIHGSCAGILLLSSGVRLYACNPCTRRWARLPPLHVDHDIVGFYATGSYDLGDFACKVLYHDRAESDCEYWIFEMGSPESRWIGRPVGDDPDLDIVLSNGILPSYRIPPVRLLHFLYWLPRAGLGNTNILVFDTRVPGEDEEDGEDFSWIPPPIIVGVNGEDVPVVGGQLFGIDECLAMTVISPAWVDVWVRIYVHELWIWTHQFHIQLPVGVINLNDGYAGGFLTAGVFAVAQDRTGPEHPRPRILVQCPRILLQCDGLGAVLQSYQLADHRTFLSRHTIQESLLLHPAILPLRDRDAVDGDPPFFQNQ